VNPLGHRDRDLADYPYDQHDQHDRPHPSQDREISLGTGTILGIFFALAVVCAVFFGFGYAMGRKSASASLTATVGSSADTDLATSGAAKPRSGSPFQTAPQNTPDSAATNAAAGPDTSQQATTQDASDPTNATSNGDAAPIQQAQQAAIQAAVQTAAQSTPQAAAARPVALHPAAKSAAAQAAAPATTAAPLPAISGAGTAMVQIAAVSHQEDADLLLAALKKRGYPVFVRQEPQDHLLHIQVGPFATRKDAEAMRQRLQTDGYNAILK